METYLEMLEGSGLVRGDIVDVSSDLRKIQLYARRHGEAFDAGRILDTLQDIVGPEGTVMVRAWSWDFCHGVPFDYRRSPSRVGALGNAALGKEGYARTQHPLYSFAVWGKYQEYLVGMENKSAWGADSPFAFLLEQGGRQLFYGSDMYNALTFVHFAEEQVGVPYRYLKDFTETYIDVDGREERRTYSMNVRDYDLDVRMFNRASAHLFPETFEEIFLREGILNAKETDGVYVGTLELAKAFPYIKDDILHNRSRKICLYKGQENDGADNGAHMEGRVVS